MLKLTKALFQLDPQAQYADYYERALWNHILASQNPTDGMLCYYLPLRAGAQKKFMTASNDFACCTGTGMENHARYGEAIYFHRADSLYVNQFIASELNWHAKDLRVRQETDFPNSAKTKLAFACKNKVTAEIKIRQGYWAITGLGLKLNGTRVSPTSSAKNYVSIKRDWSNGDTLEVELPLSVHPESMPDNPKRVALLYGPIVLAADLGPATTNSSMPVLQVGTGTSLLDKSPTVTLVEKPPERRLFPVLVPGNTPINAWLKPVSNESMVFRTADIGRPINYELRPLYQIYDRRYSVYFDSMDERGWKSNESEYRAEQERLERNRKKL
jgi:DUF1680 family protein